MTAGRLQQKLDDELPELRLQREFRRSGFISTFEYIRNVMIRGGYRLVPWWLRRAVYKPVVAMFSGRPQAAVGR